MKEEIEKEAHEYANNFNTSKMNIEWQASYRGFIAGAKFAHNAALSEAIEKIEARIPKIAGDDYKYGLETGYLAAIEILEGLKIKS